MDGTEERAWVIERHINSVLHYWTGMGAEGFYHEDKSACRFAREQDAQRVLRHCLTGHGRVAEHVWLNKPEKKP